MLYFHFSMNADDDGFVNNPKKIQKMCGASDDDFKLLIAKSFIILFDSGIIVIKHWKMHNYIQADRYRPTDYVEEKSMLGIKSNKAYTLDVSKMDTECIQNGYIGKVSIDKDSIDKDNISTASNDAKAVVPINENQNKFNMEFEKLWEIYPNKKGKAKAYKKMHKLLKEYSLEELTRCVDRYRKEVQGKEKQFIKQGDTFFNGGYIDYLDEN